jgi:hypothetical protein
MDVPDWLIDDLARIANGVTTWEGSIIAREALRKLQGKERETVKDILGPDPNGPREDEGDFIVANLMPPPWQWKMVRVNAQIYWNPHTNLYGLPIKDKVAAILPAHPHIVHGVGQLYIEGTDDEWIISRLELIEDAYAKALAAKPQRKRLIRASKP